MLRGNGMADAAAASMLDQLPVEVNQAVCAARQAVRRTTRCLAEVQSHFVRVGEQFKLSPASVRQVLTCSLP